MWNMARQRQTQLLCLTTSACFSRWGFVLHKQGAALQPVADGQPAAKRKGKGPTGPVLGKGTVVFRAIVDAAAAEGTEVSDLVQR